MKQEINKEIDDAIKAITFLKKTNFVNFIENSAKMIADCFKNGNKILIAGNGGSLCDAMHFAEEFSGYFRKKRKALPALALSDPGLISCVANDESFEEVFARGAEAFLKKGDIFIGLTTSGNSKNIINGLLKAKQLNAKTIAFLGKSGGKTKGIADLEIIVEGFETSDRIQEAHMTMIHILIGMVEKILFSPNEILEKLANLQEAKIS
ncbi:MAG: phosphoheptose isomerase [Chlamydiae bacterium RIFCSPLOWO2_01_FULL_28_7]|nr:MAG: phosphoheptose isomerase [Chlamydiae bacterium RIFCSPLOWO2_01_FULL_28_7]